MSGHNERLLGQMRKEVSPSRSGGRANPEGEPIEMEVLDDNIMESTGLMVAMEVGVVRFIFGAAFGQSIVIVGLAYAVFSMSARLPIYDKRVAAIVMWCVTFVTLMLLAWLRKAWIRSILVLSVLTLELSLITGFIATILGDIAPIQFMVCVFCQAGALCAYTFISPRRIDAKKAAAVLVVVTVSVWCVGLFAFFNDKDWGAAIAILLISFGLDIYYVLQIKHATRYNNGEKVQAFAGLFVDPLLTFASLIGACCTCICRRRPVEVLGAFEDNAVIV